MRSGMRGVCADTTKQKRHGTGLGLSISHGIVNDHGGQLIIDSVEGMFTRVSVLLPAGPARDS